MSGDIEKNVNSIISIICSSIAFQTIFTRVTNRIPNHDYINGYIAGFTATFLRSYKQANDCSHETSQLIQQTIYKNFYKTEEANKIYEDIKTNINENKIAFEGAYQAQFDVNTLISHKQPGPVKVTSFILDNKLDEQENLYKSSLENFYDKDQIYMLKNKGYEYYEKYLSRVKGEN